MRHRPTGGLQTEEIVDTRPGQPACQSPSRYTNQPAFLLDLQLFWGASAQQTGQNNGNLQSELIQTCTGPGYATAANYWEGISYDGVNRITSFSDGSSTRMFNYDAYGNMWEGDQAGSTFPVSGAAAGSNVYLNNNRNQRNDAGYDAAGNETAIPGLCGSANCVQYDAENRQTYFAASNVTYLYDGDGRRVQKASPAGTTTYVYDAMGQLAAEYSSATSTLPCSTCYLSTDHLGSTRMVTDQNGNVVSRHDYMPFGEEITAGYASRPSGWGSPDSVNQKFTGKERDSESGLDYFGARYYGSALGRWTSPDWSGAPQPVPYAKLENPQSLNLYSYVLNNPLSSVDKDGHACSSLLGNSGSGFCQRAAEYTNMDSNAKIRSQTRFFAAASATSQVLADVASNGNAAANKVGAGISPGTGKFLENVGKDLEKLNQKEASAIQGGSLSGPNLDARMVHAEQTEVQSQLDSLQKSDASGYKQAIAEINGSLNATGLEGAAARVFPTDRAYNGVLDGVRGQLGRNISFANQGDREAIGNALINHIRQTGGSDVTGAQ